MKDHSDKFEPAFQRAKVDTARARQELSAAETALWQTLQDEVGSQMIRDAILVKACDYARAYRGVTEAEHAEETYAYVNKSVSEIDRVCAAIASK